ncbi:hypothetical protein [Streptomyces ortus]|uniref:DNA-binding protein n=1 Tax=Streptomyces ortus TaxID=2867268 RepID=A0ABT3UXR4_9ACTN|nr:hypothetical protein [Streptomyces ortus]MCX4232113.1 hypothetical protein [Streptomyces ortus]
MSAPDTPTVDIDSLMYRDGYMKPRQAAAALGCGERWLLDGLNHHGFPHTRLGRAKWLSEDNLREIRTLCQIPADRSRIARLRRSSTKPARAAA